MIIGLAGKKQSGKSTVANYLIDVFDFHEISWAYPLKEVIGRQLFGLPDEVLYGDSPKREEIHPTWGMSGRQILQKVGTDLFRNNFDENFWVKVGLSRIMEQQARKNHVVVSDCRFPNELEAIKQFGGFTCKIQKVGQETGDEHESERALDKYTDWDYILIAEQGDLRSLKSQASTMVHQLKGV
jgi:hypothetical protein